MGVCRSCLASPSLARVARVGPGRRDVCVAIGAARTRTRTAHAWVMGRGEAWSSDGGGVWILVYRALSLSLFHGTTGTGTRGAL